MHLSLISLALTRAVRRSTPPSPPPDPHPGDNLLLEGGTLLLLENGTDAILLEAA